MRNLTFTFTYSGAIIATPSIKGAECENSKQYNLKAVFRPVSLAVFLRTLFYGLGGGEYHSCRNAINKPTCLGFPLGAFCQVFNAQAALNLGLNKTYFKEHKMAEAHNYCDPRYNPTLYNIMIKLGMFGNKPTHELVAINNNNPNLSNTSIIALLKTQAQILEHLLSNTKNKEL